MANSIGYVSEVPAPPIRKPKTNAEEKRKFYEKEIQKEVTKIEDVPQEFRNVEVYVLALSHVKDLAEKRHVVKIMMRDAKGYREAEIEDRAIVLENLKGLVFGKVTMQENSENKNRKQ